MNDPFPCPKCNRLLKPSGVVTVDAAEHPVYQCDECLVTGTMFGEPMELALTFWLDSTGTPQYSPDM